MRPPIETTPQTGKVRSKTRFSGKPVIGRMFTRDKCRLFSMSPRRELTPGESVVLGMIQQGCGSQNVPDDVFFTDAGDAAILVKAPNGSSTLMVNLTNLAEWRANGTISSDADLKRDWLRLP